MPRKKPNPNPRCKCGKFALAGKYLCRACIRTYAKEWRRLHPYTPEQRYRNKLQTYIRRGTEVQEACEKCGDPKTRGIIDGQDMFARVIWLCEAHDSEYQMSHPRQPKHWIVKRKR